MLAGAGDLETRLSPDWHDRPLGALIGQAIRQVRTAQRQQLAGRRRAGAAVESHGAQGGGAGHARRQRAIEQDAVALFLQGCQLARRAVLGQGSGVDGQHHALRRQLLQQGQRQLGRAVELQHAVERRDCRQQIGRAEQQRQRVGIAGSGAQVQAQRHPLVSPIGDRVHLHQRERGQVQGGHRLPLSE